MKDTADEHGYSVYTSIRLHIHPGYDHHTYAEYDHRLTCYVTVYINLAPLNYQQ